MNDTTTETGGLRFPKWTVKYFESLQPLTEMSTRNIKIIMFLGSKVRRVRKADNLTAIYEPIV
jgi:hypothetical protein